MLRGMQSALQPQRVEDVPPQLDPRLNRSALADQFGRRGRINIPEILTRRSADRLHFCLSREVKYRLCTNLQGRARALENLTEQERHAVSAAAWREVGIEGFQFLYEMHLVTLAGEPYAGPHHYLASLVQFLNGPEFLGFAREITGIADIAFADAQATLYGTGHFLTAHDDDVRESKRRVAYVLGLTPVWRPEWGGLLEFPAPDGEIETGFLPGFNTLKLFRVPQSHYVSVVAPYARSNRYSVTGWLRAR